MAIILVDVDYVTARTHEQWLKRYNDEFEDNLRMEDVKSWGIDQYVKPVCGKQIYKYLRDTDLYDNVLPVEGALWGVNTLRSMGHRVVFLSAGIHIGKLDWLLKHKFIETEKDLIIAQDKSLINSEFLIDDGWHNIESFKQGIGLLFDAPHNRQFDYSLRVCDWKGVVEMIYFLEKIKSFYGSYYGSYSYAGGYIN
jgi:5'-nucleotidase